MMRRYSSGTYRSYFHLAIESTGEPVDRERGLGVAEYEIDHVH